MEAAMNTCSLIDAKLEEHRVCSSQQCPSCGHKLPQKPDWVGLPAGVKFDPTDQELIEHLEAKVRVEDLRSHPLIDEFIPTIGGEDGICYTHPEKLPGVRRDGLSKHFFHRPSKAYTTGTRKRRKIQSECDLHKGETRWHKTGKTRPVMVNGRQKGCKKILVLYTNFGKHRKPEKTNWVMHQYHLGESEEEKEGELVVCKIFYQTQPRQCSWPSSATTADQRRDQMSARTGSCSSKIAAKADKRYSSAGVLGTNSRYSGMEMHQVAPFTESYNEVGMGEAAKATEDNAEQENRLRPPHQRQAVAPPAAAFHVARPPMNPISAINVANPRPLQQAPCIVLEDPYRVPAILLDPLKFQQQQEQQVLQGQHNLGHRSASGLEELVMSCTSTGIEGETSRTPHSQEAEWHYSYWVPESDHRG